MPQERCILDGTLTVNYEQVDVDYRLRHNDLLANIVHRYLPISVLFTRTSQNLTSYAGTRPRSSPSPSTSSTSPRTWSSLTSPARYP